MFVLIALVAGWAAGTLLESQTAARDAMPRSHPATAPAR